MSPLKRRALLAVDVGNTSVTIGVVLGKQVQGRQSLPGLHKGDAAAEAVIAELAKRYEFTGVAMCSVVPRATASWKRLLKRYCSGRIMVLNHESRLPVNITFSKPETIGPDRLANAVGAAELLGAPVVVIDIGTALTFDVVVPAKGYIGGIIAPGLPLMFDYMAEKTALLPHITPAKLRGSIGKSTEEAMRIGAQLGYRGMVREMLAEVKKDLGYRKINVCGTGGYAKLVLPELDSRIQLLPNLTLYGLSVAYAFSQKDKDE